MRGVFAWVKTHATKKAIMFTAVGTKLLLSREGRWTKFPAGGRRKSPDSPSPVTLRQPIIGGTLRGTRGLTPSRSPGKLPEPV